MFKSKAYSEARDKNELTPELISEQKKRQFFSRFARMHFKPFELHKKFNLLPRGTRKNDLDEDRVRYVTGNPSMHCLVEGVAADTLGSELKASLGLTDEDIEDLTSAALYHDFYKREDIRKGRELKKHGQSPAIAFGNSGKKSSEILANEGVSQRVMDITESCGHTSLANMERLLTKTENDLTSLEKLQLVFHFLDDITLNNEIVSFDRRMDGLEQLAKEPGTGVSKDDSIYHELNEEGRQIFSGRTTFQVQREVGRKVANWLAKQLGVETEKLHEFILEKINKRIEQEQLT